MENKEEMKNEAAAEEISGNFIHDIIDEDLRENPNLKIHTRFPPEPNGYLHIGSAKAIRINWQIARKYNGLFNLRYDDTNPVREGDEYVRSIYEDLCWLGCKPTGGVFYGSDYFDKCYEYAVKLIKDGKAYVDDLSAEEMKEYRGTLTQPGRESPCRGRSGEENLDLFERMKNGEFPDGSHTLRAKIDMASPNMNMRDPAIYRILHTEHHRQGNKWCIYPLYDYAHPIQDALEGITHSCCSLEFENHRPLYEWVVDNIGFDPKPKQREFARLNVTHTVMSKRYLRQLVETGLVDGWDDPRMPTLCGLRRRGYTPKSIRNFCERVGVAKSPNTIPYAFLEFCLREDLNETAQRVMAVLKPVKLTITNYPEGKSEMVTVENNPNRPEDGTREVSFSRHLWIEQDDFLAEPIPKYKRLYPNGPECRLKGAYLITCTGCVKDENGNVVEILATYDPESRGGDPADGRKVKGATIHWVDAENCCDAEVRQYDNLFNDPDPDAAGKDFLACLNDKSLEVLTGCKVEASLRDAKAPASYQFMRLGYFCPDSKDCAPGHLVFNRSVSLKDSFKPGK